MKGIYGFKPEVNCIGGTLPILPSMERRSCWLTDALHTGRGCMGIVWNKSAQHHLSGQSCRLKHGKKKSKKRKRETGFPAAVGKGKGRKKAHVPEFSKAERRFVHDCPTGAPTQTQAQRGRAKVLLTHGGGERAKLGWRSSR